MSGKSHSPTSDGRAFGCPLSPQSLRIVAESTIAGFAACRTSNGCWHVALVAEDGRFLFEAEICLNTERALREIVTQYVQLSDEKRVQFLRSLPALQRDAAIARMVGGIDVNAPDRVAREILRQKGLR
jgi:hypothetical protein